MPIELSELMQLDLGQRPHLKVGDLPRVVATRMGCHPAVVYLDTRQLQHIAKNHQEMKREEFQSMYELIANGSYYWHSDYPRSVTIFGNLTFNTKLYMLGLKSAEKGCEVWVATMFRIDSKKAKRKIRKAELIFGKDIT